jgi:hypothetical protein
LFLHFVLVPPRDQRGKQESLLRHLVCMDGFNDETTGRTGQPANLSVVGGNGINKSHAFSDFILVSYEVLV